METIFSSLEEQIIEQMCDKLAKSFGVTCMDGHVTVRFGERKCVTMKIVEIEDGDKQACFGCGDMYRVEELHDAKVSIEMCSGQDYVSTKKMCYDCYCPQ